MLLGNGSQNVVLHCPSQRAGLCLLKGLGEGKAVMQLPELCCNGGAQASLGSSQCAVASQGCGEPQEELMLIFMVNLDQVQEIPPKLQLIHP